MEQINKQKEKESTNGNFNLEDIIDLKYYKITKQKLIKKEIAKNI